MVGNEKQPMCASLKF